MEYEFDFSNITQNEEVVRIAVLSVAYLLTAKPWFLMLVYL